MYKPVPTSPEDQQNPGIFYGYIVVGAAFLIMLVGFGQYTTFGVFVKPLAEEFGWSRATISGAVSTTIILNGVVAILTGQLTDRFGPRVVLTFCGFFLGLGCLLMSQVNSVWQMYLFYGVIGGIGMSGIWVPLLSTVARWFSKRRSLMTGIVLTGTGLGNLIMPPLVNWLIASHSWRFAFLILGILVLLVMILAAQFLKRDPSLLGQLPYGYEPEAVKEDNPDNGVNTGGYSLKGALGTHQFWMMIFIGFGAGICMWTITVHIVPHATDIGYSATSAANILAAAGGVSILGSIIIGSLADRIGNRQAYIICFIITAAALFPLVPARDLWMLYLFAVMARLSITGGGALHSPLIADLFGMKSHGLIFGVSNLGYILGAAGGPFMAGYIYDLTRSYNLAFLICGSIAVISLILAAALRPIKTPEPDYSPAP